MLSIKSESFTKDSYLEQLDFSNLAKGIYLLKLTILGQSTFKKINIL
jgi:hypothetical protein